MTDMITSDNKPNTSDKDSLVKEKLIDAMTPGYQVEFDPEEAELAGAFIEDALSEKDALESSIDLIDI